MLRRITNKICVYFLVHLDINGYEKFSKLKLELPKSQKCSSERCWIDALSWRKVWNSLFQSTNLSYCSKKMLFSRWSFLIKTEGLYGLTYHFCQ